MKNKRKLGPASKLFSVKAEAKRGMCAMKRCKKKASSPKGRWCEGHQLLVRKAQLALNNKEWRKRIERGEAGHHVVYKGKPTEWAVKNKDRALELVKTGHSVASKTQTFGQMLESARG